MSRRMSDRTVDRMSEYVSDRQNLNWKMRSSGQSYRFWEFTISFYSISWLHHLHPPANCVRKAFLHLHFSVWSMFDYPALSFAALQLYGMLWYLSMQLQITVAPSFLKLRNKFKFSCWKIWMSSHNDMLHAFHSLPSVWVANHHHGPMLLPWLSSSRRKIAKPDLQVQVCRCARDEPGLTKAVERRKRICIAAKRSQ